MYRIPAFVAEVFGQSCACWNVAKCPHTNTFVGDNSAVQSIKPITKTWEFYWNKWIKTHSLAAEKHINASSSYFNSQRSSFLFQNCKWKMADLRSTLFVGNLSVFCTEQDILQIFSPYGQILEIRMAKSEDSNKHLSYGFVKFSNVASAQLAMHDLKDVVLCGRPLK